jgi:excisionase family DNA binding protein
MNLISTTEAATRLGVSARRVVALIRQGKLPSQRVGRAHLILPKDVDKILDRPPGRPVKE